MATAPQRLLFVDDEDLVLRGMRRALLSRQDKWDMTFVDNGAEALRLLDTAVAAPFDAIISDMRMPDMDGSELLNRVMQRHPRTIRVALSGYADRELILRCVGAAHQYLMKPCDAAVLEHVLTRMENLALTERDENIRNLVARCTVLPSVPGVYSDLVELLNDPQCLIEDVGTLVALDPAMSSKLLKIVNSAFFGLGRLISHPGEAAMLLGLETIRSLVLGAHMFQPLPAPLPGGFSLDRLWAHCLTTADAAQSIAKSLGGNPSELNDAYVAGLLHDIGKLLLCTNFTEAYAVAMVEHGKKLSLSVERSVFGADHAEVGAYFLGLWGLPERVIEAIAFHHNPSAAVDRRSIPLLALHVGNHLAAEYQASCPEVAPGTLDHAFLESHGCEHKLEVWRDNWRGAFASR
jgi:putative nucleotidyltransferase with HDIG domain